MFFIILGNLEPRPLACAARHHQRPVRDAGSPGNTCGSAALHALPRAAARCGARHRGGGNLRGDSWLERSAVDGWTAAGGGPAVYGRAVLLLIWRYKAVPRLSVTRAAIVPKAPLWAEESHCPLTPEEVFYEASCRTKEGSQ